MTCINSRRLFIFLAYLVSATVADVAFHLASLSAPRAGLSAIEAGSKVYFIGGFEHGDVVATKTIEVYDLIAQNMSSPLQLDTPRAFITPVLIEPNIYLIGGYGYSVPTMLYDPLQRQFVNTGDGPAVVNVQTMSLFDSFLVRIGANGVDILDTQLGQWKDLTPFSNFLSEMAKCGIISEQGVVIVLGGVNVTSEVFSSSAWVYNVTSGELHEYPNIVTAGFVASNVGASYGSNGVVAISIGEAVLLHHLERRTWRTVAFYSLTNMVSLPDTTLISNGTTLATLDWNNPDSQLVYEVSSNALRHVFVINNTAVYITEGPGVMIFNVYSADLQLWLSNLTSTPTFDAVLQSVSLESGWHIFATIPAIYGYNPTLNKLYQVQNIDFIFGVSALISAEESDQVYIIESGRVTKVLFSASGTSNLLVQQPCAITPIARIGSDFLDGQGRVVGVGNLTQAITTNFPFSLYATKFNDEHFAVVPSNAYDYGRVYYDHVDIYNYVTNEWNSTAMPAQLKSYGLEVQWFYSATALDDKLVVWKNSVISVYDPMTGNWTSYNNYNQSTINNIKTNIVFMPVQTAQGKAFMRTDNSTLDIFSADTLPSWNSTTPAPMLGDSFQSRFQQCLEYNDSQLFINSIAATQRGGNYGVLLIYDVVTDTWRGEQLPNSVTAPPTIVLAGGYLLSMNNNILSYYDLINRTWDDQELAFTFFPAVVLETKANVTFMAGGLNKFSTYSNRMMIIPHDAIAPKSPSGTPIEAPSPVAGLSEGELIAAIVVPIGAVLIATALLVFFLVRRQKQRRRRSGSSTMTGLESKYGQWFIPFNNIKFGDQLGQGASGQVFKGTWNGASVALKVSMTQANLTVISELELMIQLRPHPNVIQLLGFSVHPETDSIILVIEFCNGGSLDDTVFDAQRQISMQQKLSWLLGMAKGVEHLHANNIVHRDIAARNVLLHQNEPKITDFGMSRLIDEDKQRGTTKSELGPIRWMSPESLKSKEYSNKSDVWSFGILMFEVIAQSEPHIDADPIEIGRLIRDNGLTPTIPSLCPSDLAELMKECWHMSPDKRISIDQIVLRLEAMQR